MGRKKKPRWPLSGQQVALGFARGLAHIGHTTAGPLGWLIHMGHSSSIWGDPF